jgi:hypothetical protein
LNLQLYFGLKQQARKAVHHEKVFINVYYVFFPYFFTGMSA